MLRLTQAEPLSLRGLRFHGHERVRVRVNTESDRAAKRVIANRLGAFSVRFPGLVIDRCNDLRVTADGSFGSRATFKRPGLQCPPA